MSVSSSPATIFSGLPYNLICSIELLEELVTGVTIDVTWTGLGGSSLVGTLTGSGTSYDSTFTRTMATISDEGSYICAIMLSSTVSFLSSSDTTSGMITIQVGE